ncbi:hypothetical protein C1H46_001716 [Malus baccata]|uniref:Uncharacterized protein n=1 Tax=Malus baccata TaxID=106549 RepID=A0A540NNT2_MALBA|nr:hypothetical protein C1H46_001716 [Malus baccata]
MISRVWCGGAGGAGQIKGCGCSAGNGVVMRLVLDCRSGSTVEDDNDVMQQTDWGSEISGNGSRMIGWLGGFGQQMC